MAQNVKLRAIEAADLYTLTELGNDIRVGENLRDIFPYPYTIKDAEAFFNYCQRDAYANNFIIDFKGLVVGVAGILRLEDVYRFSGEIGYWVGQSYWNKGIATHTVHLLIDLGFKELKLKRLQARVFSYNIASKRVLEKSGFLQEGVFKKSVFKKGVFWDEYRYGLLNTIF